ncbi:MAG: hypothetical protein AD742_06435 [Methylibium sp. NZG]|nr:MAG: hypothetical protein AD742_06435 [Methylibium sp. NZG]
MPGASAPAADAAVDAQRSAQEKQVVEQALQALSRSPDPLARATALLLDAGLAKTERLRTSMPPMVPCEDGSCQAAKAAAASAAEMMRAIDPASEAAFEAVARMAAASSDPRLYQLAVRACSDSKREPGAGACRLVSAEQWARLDSGNAAAWRHVARSAAERGDAAAVAEAMHRMAQAQRSHVGWGLMLRQVIEHAPAGDEVLEATLSMAVSVISMQSMGLAGDYQVLTRFCAAAAVADANRRQTCSAIAEVMVGRSDTMMDQGIGSAIGQRSGWPPARADAFKRERDEISERWALFHNQPQADCATMRRQLAYFTRLDAEGEQGAMKALAADMPSILGVPGRDRPQSPGYSANAK